MKGRSTITGQQLVDSGLNMFAVDLLAESINGHGKKEQLRKPFSFMFKDVIFTLSLCPEREWTAETLLDIFKPFADLDGQPSFLIHFARAFVAADASHRARLVHLALMLADEFRLWPEPPPVIMTPAAVPSDCVLREWEAHERDGVHVRMIVDGEVGSCWCLHIHAEGEAKDVRLTARWQ